MESGNSATWLSEKPEKDSQSKPLLVGKLDQSLVAAKDLSEQPESDYILLTGAGRPVYYAVDTWDEENNVITFRDRFDRVVYVCRTEGTWALVARDRTIITTDGEMAKHQLADAKMVEAFYESLDPEGWKEAQKVAAAGGIEAILSGQAPNGHAHAPREDGKPVPGQYL